jgi:hypothetical protein
MRTFMQQVNAIESLIAANADMPALQSAVQTLYRMTADQPAPERLAALTQLAPLIVSAPPLPAALVAIVIGAWVEGGAPAHIAADAVVAGYRAALFSVLHPAYQLHAWYEEDKGQRAADDNAEDEADIGALVARYEERISQPYPQLAQTLDALDIFYKPFVALLARDTAARARAAGDAELRGALNSFPFDMGFIAYPKMLLCVLNDAPLIVLHPDSGRGYRVTINGVVGNHQLYTLLEAALIGDEADGWLAGTRPSEAMIANATAYYEGDASSFSTYNLFNWTALNADGTMPPSGAIVSEQIWIEGIPSDIRALDGTRIVLLGALPYQRSWSMSAPFTGLQGAVTVEAKLSADEVRAWLAKIAAARRGA